MTPVPLWGSLGALEGSTAGREGEFGGVDCDSPFRHICPPLDGAWPHCLERALSKIQGEAFRGSQWMRCASLAERLGSEDSCSLESMRRGSNLLFTLSHFTNSLSYFMNTRFPRRRFCPIIGGASRSSGGLAFSAGAVGFRTPSRGLCEGTTRTRCYMILRYCLISLLAASLFAKTPSTNHSKNSESVQAQPAPERIAEIQAALKAHGYEPGDTWEETREVCRKIADEHMWQTDHAPDARVLILLGLGGPHSDPAVTQMQGDRLDNDQRIDAAHRSEGAEAYAAVPVPASVPPSVPSPVPPAKHFSVPAASSKTTATSSTPVASVKANVRTPAKRHVRKATLVRSKSAPKKKLSTRNTSQNRRLHPA